MNQTSIEKIQAATPFLKWFRRYLPIRLQNTIRPYLDQPYQMALAVLDRCSDTECRTVEDIAAAVKVSKSTTRQVLNALRNGGMQFTVSESRSWIPLENGCEELEDFSYPVLDMGDRESVLTATIDPGLVGKGYQT